MLLSHGFPMIFPVAAPRRISGCRVRGHGPGLWETPLGHQSDTHLGVQGPIGSHRVPNGLGAVEIQKVTQKGPKKKIPRGNCDELLVYLLGVAMFICLLLLLLLKKKTYLYFFNDPPRIEIG